MPELPNLSCEKGWRQKFKNALVIILFALSTSLELDYNPSSTTSTATYDRPPTLLPEPGEMGEEYNFEYELAIQFAPILYFSEHLEPDEIAAVFEVVRLDGESECLGVSSEDHDTERYFINYGLLSLNDGGPAQIGVRFPGGLSVSLNRQTTEALKLLEATYRKKVLGESNPNKTVLMERPGDISQFGVLVKRDPLTGGFVIEKIVIKNHHHDPRAVAPVYDSNSGRLTLVVSEGKHSIYPPSMCNVAAVGRLSILDFRSDYCSDSQTPVDVRHLLTPDHNVNGEILFGEGLLKLFGESDKKPKFPHGLQGSRSPEYSRCRRVEPQQVASGD